MNIFRFQSVEQIINVLTDIQGRYESGVNLKDARIAALKRVAKKYERVKNTIHDACSRRLDINTEKFDYYLEQWLIFNRPSILKEVLLLHTDWRERKMIINFFHSPRIKRSIRSNRKYTLSNQSRNNN